MRGGPKVDFQAATDEPNERRTYEAPKLTLLDIKDTRTGSSGAPESLFPTFTPQSLLQAS